MLDFAFGFWKTKLKREIVKAKTHNRKSKNLKLQQRRGKIEIISPFCASTFSGFRLSLIRVFFFASSQAGGWSRRWTLQPRCRHHCGFDPHVCQGFKAPSLAQGFTDFPAWNIGLPPTRLVTLREPHICKTVVHFAVGKLAFKFTIPSHSRCEFDLRLGYV